jgi:hypothetical protein
MFTTSSAGGQAPADTITRPSRIRRGRRVAAAALLAGSMATLGIGSATSGAGGGKTLAQVSAASVVPANLQSLPRPTINPQPLPPGHSLPLPAINPQPLPPGA